MTARAQTRKRKPAIEVIEPKLMIETDNRPRAEHDALVQLGLSRAHADHVLTQRGTA